MRYIFECTLFNENKKEEEFIVSLESPGQSTAKDEIEKMLTLEYGWITKRIYQGEQMKSKRYWDIVVKSIDMTELKVK